jgi:hypothetical protein
VTVSAPSLSLFRRLSSRFGIDSMRYLDYTGRGKRGRGRGSCASFHGAGSSGEITVKVVPALPADTWASAAAQRTDALVEGGLQVRQVAGCEHDADPALDAGQQCRGGPVGVRPGGDLALLLH